MAIKPAKFFILLCCLFSFILSEPTFKTFNINYPSTLTQTNSGSVSYKISANTYNMGKYFHIIVNSLSTKNQVVTLSTDDQKCLESRVGLGMAAKGPINLFMPTSQMQSYTYLCIQCLNENECDHTISLSDEDSCELELGEQYSYYVDAATRNMNFQFSTKKEVSPYDDIQTTFWIKGENIQSTNLSVNQRSLQSYKQQFAYGNIYRTSYQDSGIYKLEVNAQVGDYVTVGSLFIQEGAVEELKLNNPEFMGLLDYNLKTLCFPINSEGLRYIARINGVVYTKKASFYFKNTQYKTAQIETTNGVLNELVNIDEPVEFCVEHYKYQDTFTSKTIFSFQLTSNKFEDYEYNQLLFAPQFPGMIYGHTLFHNEIGLFQARKPKENAIDIHFNIKALKGFPDMLFSNICLTFPDCNYKEEDIRNLLDPGHSNRMTLFSYYLDSLTSNFNPISSFQPLLVVNCLDATAYDKTDDGYCVFETSIYTNLDPLNLVEGNSYSQYLLELEHNLYSIDIEYEEDLEKVYLDLIVFSGDVYFDIDDSVVANKYFLSNKIFYSIHVKELRTNLKKLDFMVTAQKNSFYLIQFQFVRSTGDSANRNIIESGVNYVESVYIGENADYFKYVDLLNFKNGPYLASFYSQNCKFIVSRDLGNDEINFVALNDNYGQVIIDEGDVDYGKSNISFKIDITNDDSTEYNKKLCMIYVTGLELSTSNTGLERSISVSEGVPQFYVFTEKYPVIKYTYHISNPNNTVVIQFNLLDKAPYTIDIHFGQLGHIEKKIHRNEQLFIYTKELNEGCVLNNEVCNLNMNIELDNKNRDRRLETTIYQVNGAPTYLAKNAVKQDILIGNIPKFYYLDVGKAEEGDITIDYKRGSGYIYAKVVKKDAKEDLDIQTTDWRGKYVFPRAKNESLPYETYFKKILIRREHTEMCDDGCYILISIENSVEREMIEDDEKNNLAPFRITITPRIFTRAALDTGEEFYIPRVKVVVNEYVIGDIYSSDDRIYHFYEVTLPFESNVVYFDWQSDSVNLFINVGEQRPTKTEAHFKLYSVGHDTIFKLTKDEIIQAAKDNQIELPESEDSIRNVVLTLGIWTDKIDSIVSSLFAFKVFMPPVIKEYGIVWDSFDVLHVRSDQKVQCKPFQMDDGYVCVFAVIFDGSDYNSSLVVYPRSHNESAEIHFAGDMIDAEEVEKNNLTYVIENLLDMKGQYSSTDGTKYLFKEKIELNKCLLFMVASDQDEIIEVLSSTYTYRDDQVFVPNPSTAQIFALRSSRIQINFETSKDLLINIVGINGGGFFYWDTLKEKNTSYYLYGFEDRLTLTSGTEFIETVLSSLVAQSTTFSWSESEQSGFVFYVTFYPRTTEYNMDQVKAGRSIEINYREVKFPLNFYTRLTDKDIAISFNFYNYYMKLSQVLQYNKPMLKIWGRVITEQEALDARFDSNRKPRRDQDRNTVYGVFDGAFATLFLNSKDVEKFGVRESDNPTLFFSAEMEPDIDYDFNGVSVELSILREESQNEAKLFAPEYVYLNGKLLTENPNYTYKLRTNIKNPYMQVEFSTNNYLIAYCVSTTKNCKEHSNQLEELEEMYINGRYVLLFKVPKSILEGSNTLYLVVYYIEDVHRLESKLANYVFKYMNGKEKDTFFIFPHDKDKIEYEMTKEGSTTTYKISFYPVDFDTVNYYVKGVYRYDKLPEEIKDTIAISESPGVYLQVDKPLIEADGKVSLFLKNVEQEISYIKILAKVDFEATKEFLLYNPIDIYADDIIVGGDEVPLKASNDLQTIHINTDNRKTVGKARNVNQLQRYEVRFDKQNKISSYIKVESISSGAKSQMLYFSPTNQDCRENRKQLGLTGRGLKAHMWIKKEQLKNQDFFYVAIQCQEGDTCSYDLEITAYEYPQIEHTIFVHNYYVSEENRVMSFRINNTLDLSETSDQTLTLYATGGKKIGLSLSHCIGGCTQYDFKIGSAITTKIQKHLYFELTVSAEPGDFISIGSKITDSNGNSLDNTLSPNEYQFIGYLKKNVLEKECYALPSVSGDSSYYLAGIFYDAAAEINFKDSDKKDIKKDYEVVTRGFYSYIHTAENNNRKYVCIGFPRADDYVFQEDLPYSLQLTDPKQSVGLFNIYTPQLRGIIYPRIIPKGSIVFFNAANLNSDNKPVIYNMLSIEGYPKMYMYKCMTYPFCHFDYKTIDERRDIIMLNEINRGTNYFNDNDGKNNSPIEAEQYVMVVKCDDIPGLKSDICHFQTTIFGRDDNVNLIEGQPFSQFLRKGDKDEFLIDFTFDKAVASKIHLDTLVATGEVSFKITDQQGEELLYHEYYLANKIYYSIPINDRFYDNFRKIVVQVEAKQNSYYSIEYKYVKNDIEESTNDIYEGINNIIPVPLIVGNNEKTINIHNSKLLEGSKFLTNFNSLNCRFEIERIGKDGENVPLNVYGSYGQDILSGSLIDETVHSYRVKVKERDTSVFVSNMCMLYINAHQITDDVASEAQKNILITDGVPQRMIFQGGVKRIRYIYPNADPTKNIAINFNVLSPANYTLIVIYNHVEGFMKSYSKSEIIYLDNMMSNDTCTENELCNIIVIIELENTYNNALPMIELTIRQINNIPYYIPKEVVHQDFLPAKSKLYLFTTLGKDDEGYLSVNFARGSAKVFANIVSIYKTGEGEDKEEPNPDWRNFTFPKDSDHSLYYDFYNKKFEFYNDMTSKCEYGCYLLISIEPSVKGDLDEQYRFYLFSITISLTPSGLLKQVGPILDIDPEEYVVGTLSTLEKAKAKDMYEFYRVNILNGVDNIEFDWQSDSAILLVNIGDKRPTLDGYDFIFNTSRSDTLFNITSEQIIAKLKEKITELTEIHLTIGVYTEDFDSSYGSAYSFRVHLPEKLNIYKVTSDQKTLCQPDKVNDNKYRCLFMVIYNELDFINDLMIYSRSQSPSAITYMYGKFIDDEIYDSQNIDLLEQNMPDENAEHNTEKDKTDFIFLTSSDIKSHFYVKVISNQPNIIEFFSSMKTFDKELSPNPSTIQLFSIYNEKTLKLNFITQKGLFINIVSLYGSAKLKLQSTDDEYSLRGRDDRLALAIPYYTGQTTPSLLIENLNYKEDAEQTPEGKKDMPGFAFYVEYYLRSFITNIDEINLGKTTEVSYMQTDFPLYYISKLNTLDYSINVFFNLHDVDYEGTEDSKKGSETFSIKGSLIEERIAYKMKREEEGSKPNLDESPIVGIYDPALKAGQVYFSVNNLKNLVSSVKDKKPTLYLSIEKTNNVNYKNFRLELTAFQENSNIPITEKIYQYGKIYDKKTVNFYKLKVDNSVTGYMRVQFAKNNNNIAFVISDEPNKKTSSKYEDYKETKSAGKILVTFKKPKEKDFIYLNVFLNDKATDPDVKMNHYTFKYINSEKKELLFDYEIENNADIKVTKLEKEMTVTFNKIKNTKADITYFVKVIKPDGYVSNEIMNTVALTESKAEVTQIPKGTTSVKIPTVNYKFVQVIGYVKDGPINEYVAYNALEQKAGQESGGNKNLVIVIIITVILLVVVIILVVVIVFFNAKNKDLMEKVNKISFVSSEAKPKGEANLLMDDNELK